MLNIERKIYVSDGILTSDLHIYVLMLYYWDTSEYVLEESLSLSWYLCSNGRAPERKSEGLRFKFQLRHKFYSQYFTVFFY